MSVPFLWRKLFGNNTSATQLLSGLIPWSSKAPLAPGAASAGKAVALISLFTRYTIFCTICQKREIV